ncbi:MAG TPA: hypothetical protein VE825_06395 [Terriglobales bacterium]|nr:hypothetical protein [Terriglobales bacterium]
MSAFPENPIPGPTAKKREVRVLSVARDQQLQLWRDELLRRQGYKVMEARTAADAMSALGKPLDVIVFGHRIPEEERSQIATMGKTVQPGIKIIMLYLGTIRRTEQADAVLNVAGRPDDLVRTIEHLLGSTEEGPAPRR